MVANAGDLQGAFRPTRGPVEFLCMSITLDWQGVQD